MLTLLARSRIRCSLFLSASEKGRIGDGALDRGLLLSLSCHFLIMFLLFSCHFSDRAAQRWRYPKLLYGTGEARVAAVEGPSGRPRKV